MTEFDVPFGCAVDVLGVADVERSWVVVFVTAVVFSATLIRWYSSFWSCPPSGPKTRTMSWMTGISGN
jgi:hypothetical protein